MVLTGRISGQVLTKSDTNKFFELFKLLPNVVPKLLPNKVRSVDLLEGDFGCLGCVMFVKYMQGGVEQEAKVRTEAVDDEKKSITFNFVEGTVKQVYKTFTISVSFDNCITLTIDFEKLNEEVPEPNDILNFGVGAFKDLETQGLLNLLQLN